MARPERSDVQPVMTDNDLLEVTLSLDTGIYASGDVLADTQEIASAFSGAGKPAILQSLCLLDKDDQGGALDLVFLRSNTSIGTENAVLNIADADADEILTIVSIAAADYGDLANSQLVTKKADDAGMGVVLEATSGTSLYVAAISRDTKTYTASGIVVKVGLVARA